MIWLHGDHLSAVNPALIAHPDAPLLFVFDEAFLREMRFGFGRLTFIYESVMEVFAARPKGTCSIRRGDVVTEIKAFADEKGATRIATTQTVGERFAQYQNELETSGLRVSTYPVAELVPYPDVERVPKRFGAWWREVEELAMET
ncbi:MAG: hypothetical protein H8F28_07715 [Fibrella sp.]|nr:hypothetical protein [Armatimonadota bacterium]